jgi:transposase
VETAYVRVTTLFNRVLGLPGARVQDVLFGDGETIVAIRRTGRRMRCPCGHTTTARYDTSPPCAAAG